ncbi:MAG: choice-of-anchor D domain-containing protein [Myxococcaceae bacterium]
MSLPRLRASLLLALVASGWMACSAAPEDDEGQGPADVLLTSPPAPLTTREVGAPPLVFRFVLGSKPTHSVTVDITSTLTSEGVVSPTALTFERLKWNTPQNVTLTGVDDSVLDPDQPYELQFSVTSSDASYQGFPLAPVAVTNLNNDLLQASPAGLSFGSVAVESSSDVATWTLQNVSTTLSTSALTDTSVTGDFALVYNQCATLASLGPSASCQMRVRMLPQAVGALTGTLTLNATMGGIMSVQLLGTGTAETTLTSWPRSFHYGSIAVGNPVPHTFVLYNRSLQALTGLSIVPSAGDVVVSFPMTTEACTTTLAAFDTCQFIATFTGAPPLGFVSRLIQVSASPASATTVGVSALVVP